jgi:hypothetical protein
MLNQRFSVNLWPGQENLNFGHYFFVQ